MGYTAEQQKAVDAPVQNILVTAAAGAGKTHVLTGRILRRISDAQATSIDRLLIITFTRAAASEMRERIAGAIIKAMEENPGNSHLRRQYNLVQNASIMTMDSFCVETLRSYFSAADIDPNFTILDSADEKIMEKEAMEECFEAYLADQNPRFIRFLDAYGGMRSTENAEKIIYAVHSFLKSVAFVEQWRSKALQAYEVEDFKTSKAAEYLFSYAKDRLLAAKMKLYSIMEHPESAEAHHARIAEDALEIDRLLKADSIEDLSMRMAGYSTSRMPTVKGTPVPKAVSQTRTAVKDILKEIDELLCTSDAVLKDRIERQYPMVHLILEVEKRFFELLMQKKKSRNSYSFSDLERITLELLTEPTENGYVPTETAREIQERFDEIYIDEYQDTNSMQEAIFGAIAGDWVSKPNTFRVGDLKQSIYRFRQTNPELFAEKKRTYTDDGEQNRKIVMSCNFRSRPQILSAINDVFVSAMTEQVGAVDYTEKEEWLHAPAIPVYQECAPAHEKAEVLVRVMKEEDPLTAVQAEAYMVGKKILELMHDPNFFVTDKKTGKKRRPMYRDFAVLSRKKIGIIPEYMAVFESLGIPVFRESPESFYDNYEVAMMLSLLSVIDNPLQDVPMAAVLHSPLFGFTADLLADIRYFGGKGELYTAMERYEEQLRAKEKSEKEILCAKKIEKALQKLRGWNVQSRILPLKELVELLIRETGWDDYVSALPGGEMRVQNLRGLSRRAAKYEAAAYRGLAYFLQFVEKTKQQGVKEDVPTPLMHELNTPHIMSIHKSKGLEFPVVFVVHAEKKFNMSEATDKLVLSEEKGIGIAEVDTQRHIRQDTLYRKIIGNEIDRDIRSDEIRILYVAMTRAREKLYITTTVAADKYENMRAGYMHAFEGTALFAKNYLDWVMPAALHSRYWTVTEDTVPYDLQEQVNHQPLPWHRDMQEGMHPEHLFSFHYPFATETQIPGKYSVTELKRMYAAEEDVYAQAPQVKQPRFCMPTKKDFTNAEKGSIIHTVLENLDFSETSREDLSRKVADMVQNGMLSEAQANAADLSMVEAFLASALYQRMQHADEIHRETPFTYLKPCREIIKDYTGDAQTMVQGMIDCWFEEKGNVVLVDYKTDRVSSAQELLERYKTQLTFYQEALYRMTGKKACEVIIYSLYLKKAIEWRDENNG